MLRLYCFYPKQGLWFFCPTTAKLRLIWLANWISHFSAWGMLPKSCGNPLGNTKPLCLVCLFVVPCRLQVSKPRGKMKFFENLFLTILFLSKTREVKGKLPPGCLLTEPVTYVTRFSMSLEPSFFGTMPLSSVLSQLHILCVAWLLPTPRIIHLRCAH